MSKINYIHTNQFHNTRDANYILPLVFKIINPDSILDVGCGNGSWLNAAKALGVKNIQGVDGIKVDEKDLLIAESEFMQHNLTTPLKLNMSYDLVISLEVAEHLSESAADTFVNSICRHGDVVLFSAAIPEQGGQFHVNEKWPDYWAKKFNKNGFEPYDVIRPEIWNNSNIYWWYKQNSFLYIKKGHKLSSQLNKEESIKSMVHPELYSRKMDKPQYMDKKHLWILLKKVLKLWLKSLFIK